MDLSVFFEHARRSLFSGSMTPLQVSGCERLIKAWNEYGTGLDTGCSYILATSYHETGRRMQPVREAYANSDAQAKARLENAWQAGKLSWVKTPYWREGWYGRGDVQLTHEDNYSGDLRDAVLERFGVDIHRDRDAVLRPEISAYIIVEGMTKGDTNKSDFTRWPLSNFVNHQKTDYAQARRAVNPGEKGSYKKIAGYALKFEKAIREARAAAGEKFLGPEENLYDGRIYAEVRQVQRRLKDLGYHAVGTVDGRWGSRTREAVLAFRADEELPIEPYIDDELLAEMVKSEGRPNGPERQTATVQDLRREKSRTVVSADVQQTMGTVGAVSYGVSKMAPDGDKIAEGLDKAEGIMGYVSRFQELLAPFSGFVNDNLPIIIGVVLLVVIWQSDVLKKSRLDDHQSGKNTGR